MNSSFAKIGVGLAALLASAGCFFSFDNPIELQPNNTVAGTVAIADARCGSSPQNVRVTLLWTSGYSANPGPDGKFLFLGLPNGIYSLRYDAFDPDGGPDAGPICSGLQPDIELPQVLDQSSDALDLGTFSLQPPVVLTGSVDAGGPVVIGAFSPDTASGPGLFESYSAESDPSGNFAISVPPGHHVIWVSSGSQSVPYDLVLDGGEDLDLGRVLLYVPDAGASSGFVQGNIVLSLPGFGAAADAGAVAALFGPGGSNFEINPPQPQPFSLTSQVPGVGTEMTQLLPPGAFFDVFCGLKDESQLPPGVVFDDLELPHIPAIAGRVTNLGQITWISNAEFVDAGLTPPADYPDNGSDAGVDGGLDAGTDGGVDAGSDGGLDAGVDAGPDGGSDAGVDAGSDAGVDAGSDGGSDAGLDAGLDAGPDAGVQQVGFDAGPPEWRLLGLVPLPTDAGLVPTSIFPVDFEGGQGVFFDLQFDGIYLAVNADGGFQPAQLVDSSSALVLGAIAGADGVPLAVVEQEDSSSAFLLSPGSDGGWVEIEATDDAGIELLPSGTGNLIPADGRPNAWGIPADAYYVFSDPETEASVDLAIFSRQSGVLQMVANYPLPNGGAVYGLQTAACNVGGDPGLCVVIQSSLIEVMSIDLATGAGTTPYQIQQSENESGSLSLQAIPDAGLLVGWLEYGTGTTQVWVPSLSEAAFACEPTQQTCAIPVQLSVSGLGINTIDLLLNLQGAPLAVFAVQEDGGVAGVPSPYDFEAAIDLTDLVDLSLPGSEYLPTTPGGFTDPLGRPVVGVVADAGSTIAAEVYTYY